ncbi:MAG TPA: LLM class flavin-dependent oxidoreductase [Candidatus Binataceae bacterium]|nr:LLM class flavin-dependent oxidoreductase [Candidatus Binataceae bacterium]
MHLAYFTERPYRYAPNDHIIEKGFFGTPNTFFDPEKGHELYHEYLDEKVLCEELGFDGVALNEHHFTPFTMGAVMDVEASILARITKKVKIILIGNPLPLGNPLRLAEELAMIDVISKGRLVAGWVRGAGSEQFAHNANPAYNREYFNEAHDFIVKAWTQPGPWRYEGRHFHYRFVDPWPVPMQKPHPPMWIPGLLSPETALWCAEKRYPYIALATFLEPTVELWNIYRDRAAELGYQVGSENFGYMQKVYVADSEEKALEIAKFDMFGGAGSGYSLFAQPAYNFPPGYNSKLATRRMATQFTDPNKKRTSSPFQGGAQSESARADVSAAQVDHRSRFWQEAKVDVNETRKAIYAQLPDVLNSFGIICGTPKTVIPKIRVVLDTLRPGTFILWQNDGPITRKDRENNLKLIAKDVMPAIRDMGKELGLQSAYEVKPGSRALAHAGKPDSVGSLEPWKAWREAHPY